MSRASEAEQAVRQLPPQDLVKFRAWFAEFDAAEWDRQIEQDVVAGRLDAMAEEALNELGDGHCSEL